VPNIRLFENHLPDAALFSSSAAMQKFLPALQLDVWWKKPLPMP